MRTIFYAAAFAACISLTGCSLLSKSQGTSAADIQKSQATRPTGTQTVQIPAGDDAAARTQQAFRNAGGTKDTAKNKKNKNKPSKNNNQKVNNRNTGKETPAGETAKDIAGEWVITSVGSTVISRDEDMPYINFVPAENRFYGSNGCNVLNGDFKISGNSLTFGNVLSTMKYCAGVDFDAAINQVIRDGRTVRASIKRIGNESYLYINDSTGKSLLTLVRHNMQFLNGYWYVTRINGKEINDEEANIFFDIAALKIHGNTGCNFFNGNILIDPAGANSINFSGMGVTRMACPKGDQERTMLVALEETTRAIAGPDDTAILTDDNGRQLLTLKRGQIPANAE